MLLGDSVASRRSRSAQYFSDVVENFEVVTVRVQAFLSSGRSRRSIWMTLRPEIPDMERQITLEPSHHDGITQPGVYRHAATESLRVFSGSPSAPRSCSKDRYAASRIRNRRCSESTSQVANRPRKV